MRYLALLLMSFIYIQNTYTQTYEVGLFFGGSNFIGDVGATNYISPNQPAVGALFKWNRSPRHSFRASVIFSDLEGIDNKSDDPRRQQRNYSFNNSIIEASLGLEFTFWEFDLHQLGFKGSPYLYTGIAVSNMSDSYFSPNGDYVIQDSNSWILGIPMVVGYKTNITEHLILGAEIGARYTFNDGIDGSVPNDESLQNLSFGNLNSNDWYVFSGLTLTYAFGRKPCYCAF